ncbi:MAG TPA: 50S ribosomal protein L11 methyltransferase, partial [Flavitalea sp.]|nr:50S ribosomal protein L11 methyltransferase [Flavitalea sp.]
MDYTRIRFTGIQQDKRDLLIAVLSSNDFEGFEETSDGLLAYIPREQFNQKELEERLEGIHPEYTLTEIPGTNWNTLWESNFEPVVVGSFCTIRADFHQVNNITDHEIIITPKMSFGTGHHATTYMMIAQMADLDFKNKRVMDFGTGTGVLAILAEKLGASMITAIDNDEWSILNARENIAENKCARIQLTQADNAYTHKKYDIILANITRNIILDNVTAFASGLTATGTLLLSGLLPGDEPPV